MSHFTHQPRIVPFLDMFGKNLKLYLRSLKHQIVERLSKTHHSFQVGISEQEKEYKSLIVVERLPLPYVVYA